MAKQYKPLFVPQNLHNAVKLGATKKKMTIINFISYLLTLEKLSGKGILK